MAGYVTGAATKLGRVHATLLLPMLSLVLGGCDVFGYFGDCSPQLEVALVGSDNNHTAQRWISICGAPGATVTDIITVTSGETAASDERGFAFDEEPSRSAAGGAVTMSWIDIKHLKIQVNEIGDIRYSPRQMDGIDIVYALGPEIDLRLLETEIYQKSDDRHQLERLRSSSSWIVVESMYNSDKYVIERDQKFVRWVQSYVVSNEK